MPDAFLLAFGSSHTTAPAPELAAQAISTAVASAGLALGDIDRLILSSAVPSTPEELSLSVAVARALRLAPAAGAFGVAFGEASGLLAIAQGADAVRSGAAHVAVAGGADTPSRVPYWVPGMRSGAASDPGVVIDPLPVALFDPETVIAVDGGDRAAQDAFALRSGERAARPPTRSADGLSKLKPIHSVDGTITVGNSAAHLDGAAVAVLADRAGEIRFAGAALVGNEGGATHALATAIRTAAGATAPRDLAAIELHESSAALCLATAAELGLDPDVLNRQGGEIATGSAGAASGVLMLERAHRRLASAATRPARAIVAAAGPGGQAIAVALDVGT